jgi:predicted enzyme related to lactoylglutathione lyase
MTSPVGRFVWRELTTSDVPAAQAFYSELFGWTYASSDMGGSTYFTIQHDGRGIGGIMPVEHAQGGPVAWTPYLGVADTDATLELVEANGGKVHPAVDIPGVGRFAVVADPGDAVFCVIHNTGDHALRFQSGPGDFHWETLTTRDLAASKEFYGKVFGWACGGGPLGTGNVFSVHGTDVADLQPAQSSEPVWLSYVAVSDVDTAVDTAEQLGARVLLRRLPIQRVGTMAFIADPQGARLALFQPPRPAQA